MTYFGFLAVFLVPPSLVLLWLLRASLRREHIVALAVLMLIALAYTSPWDNYLVIRGVWSFDRERIAAVFIWRVPLEEYIFYLLQVLMTGLFTIWLLGLTPRPPSLAGKGVPTPRDDASSDDGAADGDASAGAVRPGTPFPARAGGRGVRSSDA